MLLAYSKAAGTFATVMHHDGEDLELAVKEAGISISRFATAMGAERNSPRRWFGQAVLPADKRELAAKVLRTTPEAIFKRLAKRDNPTPTAPAVAAPATAVSQSGPIVHAKEPMQQYGSTAASADYLKCVEERDKWRQLAYDNLTKYNELLVEHNQLLRLARLGTTSLVPNPSH